MDETRRLKIAIAREQLEHWMLRFLKGIELKVGTSNFVDRVEFWTEILRMNGYEPFANMGPR